MITKINRQECLSNFSCFPLRSYDYKKEGDIFFFPKTFTSYILTFPSKSFKGHAMLLGTEITKLTKAIESDNLTFLGDTELAWRMQENDYPPAKAALDYLISNKVGKRFNGALVAGIPELPFFIKNISWLIRCNASLPYIYFTDMGQNIVGNICQYGNLHLAILNQQTDKRIKIFLKESKFTKLMISTCTDQFGKTSAIKGRQILPG